ncbi:vWA domain-containing protein [Variovorax sp. IB41]|uniref:vWA domain-containing protein n=1 Tax=Variovorax sp. IB41 TaxID=2779370 RepID=UPI0018E87D4D|nr:VWA domain-containing protein [Variovorax sp. IB41]MBJ2157188.1 VWA domain-containing protein [Variovorax sp. IB41]
MAQPFAPRFRRPLVVLLCAQFLWSASGATEIPAVGSNARWPQPALQVSQTEPNFQAPSATHCARPVQTHETPGARNAQLERPRATTAPTMGRLDAAPPEALRKAEPAAAAEKKAYGSSTRELSAAVPPVAASVPAPVAAAPMPVSPAPRASIAQPAQAGRPANEPVTAGMVDDNADFSEYLNFRGRTQVAHRERDVSMRYLLQVRDARGAAVPDAEVAVQAPSGAAMWARTDAGGRAWLHPLAFDRTHSQMYEVTVRKNGRQGTAFLQRGQKSAVDVVIDKPGAAPARAQLDLVFLIDATGSMADEIAKLKGTLRTIADEVARLPSRPDTCFGLVAYRDVTDDFVVRRHDFTDNLDAFQGVLDGLQAAGGGDYPEAMNEALAETVHQLSWRGTGTTRLVVLLADAPPHLDYGGPQYDDSMVAALGKGIKVFSVGASGLDKQGEYIQRQIAQYTGGRFVFLTYKEGANPASGPGAETRHDVANYSVQTLDRLIVRLVTEELGKLPAGG